MGRLAVIAMRDGFLQKPQAREYYALFPNFFLYGSPLMHFSHTVIPISANKSRGVIRLYWVGADENASMRYGREFALASARDVHVEDRQVIEAGQKGLESGALEHIHLQSQEVLLRHLYHMVDERVQAYKAEPRAIGSAR